MSRTAQDILRQKGNDVWSVLPTTTVYEALELMALKDIGAVLVMEKNRLLGLFSERDYARKVILEGRSSKEVSVMQLMATNVHYVTPQDTVEDCMLLMTKLHMRHLPVLDGDQVMGIITIGDVVKQIIQQHECTIEQLERYITGHDYSG